MEAIPALNLPRRILVSIFGYTIFLYIFFLLFNTSFTIMGVDVGDYLKEYLGDFFGVYLVSTLKVFGASLVFHLSVGIVFYFTLHISELKNSRLQIGFLLLFLILIDALGFIHSIIQFPQIYGEFFFYRHTWSVPFLYFCTDHLSPFLIQILIGAIFLFKLILVLRKLFLIRSKRYFFLLTHILITYFLHSFGLFYLSIAYFLCLPLLLSAHERIHIRSYLFLIPFLLFLFPFPWFADSIYGLLTKTDENKPPIFLISADSLRYDKLGFTNGNSAITPNIDLFAKDSINFHDHHTTIPRTFPSWADLLTGQYSMSHKIRDMFPSPEERDRIGSPEFPTIAQKLKGIGYKSAAVGSFAGDIFPRANFGYDEVQAPNFNARIMTVQRTAESQLFLLPVLTGSFLGGGAYIPEMDGLSTWGDGSRILERLKHFTRKFGDSAFFITYFSSVVHFPYTPAYPQYKKFTSPDYYGKNKYLKFVDPLVSQKPNQVEIEQIRNLFDSAVFAFDLEFGEILKYLKEQDLYDKSIIILTSDHGEALYEDVHGQGHGEHLRGEAVTKIPFLIKFPKNSKIKNTLEKNYYGVTSSVDLFPTIMDYFQLESNGEFPGISLLSLLGKNNDFTDRVVYSETGIWFSDRGDHFFQKQRIPYPSILELHEVIADEDYQIMITDKTFQETIAFAKHRSVQNGQYKLIYIPTRKGVIFELYDRKNDPQNTKNLYPLGLVGVEMREKLFNLVKKWEEARQAGDYLLPGTLRKSD